MAVVLLSDCGLTRDLEDVVQLDPEVLETRAIFDVARVGLLECVSGSQAMIDLAEAQRLLDALKTARTLAAEAEDRVLIERSLLTSAAAKRRASARYQAARRVTDETTENPGSRVAQPRSLRRTAARVASRGAAFLLVRAVLPAAAALAGAALARRLCRRYRR